jgi:hypothetical protein
MPHHPGIILMHSAPGMDALRMAEVIASFVHHVRVPETLANRAFAWNLTAGWHERH